MRPLSFAWRMLRRLVPSRVDRRPVFWRRNRVPQVERLEDRALLTVTASFVDGHLAVASDWRDEIVVDVESGFVKVNGTDLDIGPIAAADVTGLSIRGGLLSPLVDAAGTSGQLAVDGVSITIPSVAEAIAEFRAQTSLGPQIEAALASGALTQQELDLIAAGQVTAEALQELTAAGIGQEWIDKGIEALDFFHAQDAADQAARQMVMSAHNPNAVGRTISGTCGDDVIDGGEGSDIIYGGAGNDQIDGAEGDDVIYGGRGNDIING
ncbi:MAG: hypothetical protein K2Y37_26950, partial [Pirellulales bacterium]|nr:hypothetical protein [Pirellulales bacterium]